VAIRSLNRQSGAMSIQMLVLLVPVIFGLMGFAVDLGRLYLIRGELTQTAESMATAAAARLIGTETATADATTAMRLNSGNYNFGSLPIGDSSTFLASEVPDPTYFATAASALGDTSTDSAGGTTAKYVRVNITADAPLLFWSLLSLGQQRKTSIAAIGVAGISAPLCTACGIEPFAVGALSTEDTTDFGFTVGTRYTLGFQCNGFPVPATLPGSTQRIPYLLIDRFNDSSTFDESQQLYRIGASGLLPGSCITVAGQEIAWVSAQPQGCNTNTVPAAVTSIRCGLWSRFDATPPTACVNVTDVETLATAYQPDTDLTDIDDYTTYTGAGRRVITIPIVDVLSPAGPMTVLGFRQFLVDPNQGGVNISVADTNGRLVVLYIGAPVPLKQGRFDGGCQLANGPGKVVLHR
jgi:Flp pilus assembly protein TadG